MRSNLALFVLLATSSVPALSAPVSLGSLGTELGKGLAVGGGLAGLGALADHFLGEGSNSQGQKREWTDLEARQLGKLLGTAAEDTIGDVLKKGLVNGAGAAVGGSVVGGLIHEFTGNDNQKREPERPFFGVGPVIIDPLVPIDLGPVTSVAPSAPFTSIQPDSTPATQKRQLGKLLGTAAEETIGDVLKKGLVNGAGAAVGGSVVGGLIHEFTGNNNDKREPIELGAVGKGLLGTAAGLGASAVIGDGIDKIEDLFGGHSNSKSKRQIVGQQRDWRRFEGSTVDNTKRQIGQQREWRRFDGSTVDNSNSKRQVIGQQRDWKRIDRPGAAW